MTPDLFSRGCHRYLHFFAEFRCSFFWAKQLSACRGSNKFPGDEGKNSEFNWFLRALELLLKIDRKN